MTDLESSENLINRYQTVKKDIANACSDTDRNPDSVALLAVSKKHSIESIQSIYGLGQRAFGENYVQEGVDKVTALSHLEIKWHFIGPIQSNKSRLVAEHFDWVHTIDRNKIATRLNQQRLENQPPLNVLIQINISDQDSKSGIPLNELESLAKSIHSMENLTLRGLMCIPAKSNIKTLENDFTQMQQAFSALKSQYETVDTLSMGMSGDLPSAIKCGSTLVRIGTAIFGERTNV